MNGRPYSAAMAAKAQSRFSRAKLEICDLPITHEFESAGGRLGWRNRADVPESARAYFDRRRRAYVAAMLERNPALVPICNGRSWRP